MGTKEYDDNLTNLTKNEIREHVRKWKVKQKKANIQKIRDINERA